METRWSEGEHRTGGTRIHYWRTGGTGKRPLVLVHGFSDNGLCWSPVARELEAEYDIIMPDMVGHGLSSRRAEIPRIDMAEDLASLIRGLKLERPVVVGHSMGAMACAQAVARHPDLAGALALEDPPWFMPGFLPGGTSGDGGDPPVVAWAKTLRGMSLERLLADYRRDHPAWSDDLVLAMCEAKKQLDQDIVDELGRLVETGGSTWPSILISISRPLLILTADTSLGAIVGPEAVARIRGIKPDAMIAAVAGVGHLIRFDAHEAFMRALRPFLEGAAAG